MNIRAARANFDLKNEIAAYWDTRADTFDASPSHWIGDGAETDAWQALLKRYLPDVPRPRVLELGCGTGIITLQLVRAGAEVTALDLGERMLRLARQKAKAAGARVEFLFGDAEDPFVAGDGFDAIVCRHLVWTLPDPAGAFRRWRVALKPGGRVLIIDQHSDRDSRYARTVRWLADRLEGDAAAATPSTRDPGSPYHHLRQMMPFGPEGVPVDTLRPLLEEAGFAVRAVDPMKRVGRARRRRSTLPQRLRSLAIERFLLAAEAV